MYIYLYIWFKFVQTRAIKGSKIYTGLPRITYILENSLQLFKELKGSDM